MSSKYSQQFHDELVKQAFNRPYKIGIPEDMIISKAVEYEMFLDGVLYVKPDLYIRTLELDYYIEIKGKNSGLTRNKGELQTKRVLSWLDHYGVRKPSEVLLLIPQHTKKITLTLEDLIIVRDVIR